MGWSLSVETAELNGISTKHKWEVQGELKLGPYKFLAGIGQSETHAYEIGVGQKAYFHGSVSPIVDNPATPEHEYAASAFAFEPYVYLERYENAAGQEAAYYVLSFAVKS